MTTEILTILARMEDQAAADQAELMEAVGVQNNLLRTIASRLGLVMVLSSLAPRVIWP